MSEAAKVFVTGCARSGTSMVAGVLKVCGLDFGGPLVKPNRWNQNGQFEHLAVRQKVLKPLLRELGADPRGQKQLPRRRLHVASDRAARLRRAVNVRLQGANGYKDAKLILVWQYFHAAFPDARWVLVRRDPKEIVASCIRTDFMNGRTYKQGWIDWVQAHEFRFEDLKCSGANVLEIWPDPNEPERFRPLVTALGLTWDDAAVGQFLLPDAFHIGRAS